MRIRVAGARRPGDIATRPITLVDAVDFAHAQRLGCTIRQVSQASGRPRRPTASRRSSGPRSCPLESPLARVAGSQNIVVLRGHYGGETVFSGSGAGGGPTSVAVVSDVAAIARNAAWRAAPRARRARGVGAGQPGRRREDGLRAPSAVTGDS